MTSFYCDWLLSKVSCLFVSEFYWNISKVWVATVFCVARTHLARPDLGSHTHVHARQFFGGRTSHPHLCKNHWAFYPYIMHILAYHGFFIHNTVLSWTYDLVSTCFFGWANDGSWREHANVGLWRKKVNKWPLLWNVTLKGKISSILLLRYIYFSYQNVGSSRILIRFFSIFIHYAFAWKKREGFHFISFQK